MRVAFITHYTSLHGANRSLIGLLDGLKKYDITPFVIAPEKGPVTLAMSERNVEVAILPMYPWVSSRRSGGGDRQDHPALDFLRFLNGQRYCAQRLYANICALPKFLEQLRKWDVDVIHTNTSVIPIGAMAARVIGRPHVWHIREFSDLHYGLDYDWGKTIFRYIIGRSDAIIAISNAIRTYHLQNASPKRTRVIYNGVASIAEFNHLHNAANSAMTVNKGRPFTFSVVGIIQSAKGQDIALRALAIVAKDFPEVRLLIVGAGNVNPLQTLAREFGVADKVEFWGYIDDPFRAYLASDAVLMCSRNEAMGRVTAEAMAACRPVIGYDSAGTSEIVKNGYTGLLYSGGPEELANCMKRLLQNPTWARELGDNGWRVAREKYTIENYADSVHEVLMSVVKLRSISNH